MEAAIFVMMEISSEMGDAAMKTAAYVKMLSRVHVIG